MLFYKKGDKLHLYLMQSYIDIEELTKNKSEELKKFLEDSLDPLGHNMGYSKKYVDFTELLSDNEIKDCETFDRELNASSICNLEVYFSSYLTKKSNITYQLMKNNPLLVEFADISKDIVYEKVGQYPPVMTPARRFANKILPGSAYYTKEARYIRDAFDKDLDPYDMGEKNYQMHRLLKKYFPQAKFKK